MTKKVNVNCIDEICNYIEDIEISDKNLDNLDFDNEDYDKSISDENEDICSDINDNNNISFIKEKEKNNFLNNYFENILDGNLDLDNLEIENQEF